MIGKKKTRNIMLINAVPLWNSSLVDLVVPNGTVGDWINKTDWSDDFSANGVANWTTTQSYGGSDGYDGVGGDSGSSGFWWEQEGGGEDPPVVKFGPDTGLLQAVGVYVNFLLFAAALVLVVAVVCRCVTAKVRLSLNCRSGPEIAFQFGADRRRGDENGDRAGDPN